MAAIDFPNTPTLNQTFTSSGRTWKWNGTAWKNIPSPATGFTISTTAPTSPNTGDGWFNPDTARSYIWYDSFWVEFGVAGSIPDVLNPFLLMGA